MASKEAYSQKQAPMVALSLMECLGSYVYNFDDSAKVFPGIRDGSQLILCKIESGECRITEDNGSPSYVAGAEAGHLYTVDDGFFILSSYSKMPSRSGFANLTGSPTFTGVDSRTFTVPGDKRTELAVGTWIKAVSNDTAGYPHVYCKVASVSYASGTTTVTTDADIPIISLLANVQRKTFNIVAFSNLQNIKVIAPDSTTCQMAFAFFGKEMINDQG